MLVLQDWIYQLEIRGWCEILEIAFPRTALNSRAVSIID
jgi:hypothetical protein